jgi:hypothetical protein
MCSAGSAQAAAMLTEWYPAHQNRSGQWPAMVEADGLAFAQVYDLIIVNASNRSLERGLVLGVAQIVASESSRVLLADEAIGTGWLTLGAARPPEYEPKPLGPGWRPQVPVTLVLIEGDSGLRRWSLFDPLELSAHGARIADVLTVTSGDTAGIEPVWGDLVLSVPAGYGAVRVTLASELVDEDWQAGPVIEGSVRTEKARASVSPGQPNPPLTPNPEPSGLVCLAVIGAVLCARRGLRGRMDRD